MRDPALEREQTAIPAVRLLGTIDVVDPSGERIEIGGGYPRVLLAMLVAADGKVVAVDRLIDVIWNESPPTTASGTLQTYVSRLRRSLGPIGATIVREFAGYRLEIDRHHVDVHRFETLATHGRAALDVGDAATARPMLIEACELWRGPALLDVRDREGLSGVARRLDERRLAVLEDRLSADVALGRYTAAVAELEELVEDHPGRERLWELLALARYRAGMQTGALRAIARARETLVEGSGVEPGAGLRRLETAILTQDPALDLPEATGSAPPAPPMPGWSPTWENDTSTPPSVPLVGRAAELEALIASFAESVAGGPRVAVVEGEAGVGKTRLVEELADRAEANGAHVGWGRCLDGEAGPPYWPWLGVLRTLRARFPERSSAALDRLLDATGTSVDGRADGGGRELLDGIQQMLTADSDEPIVVVIEDVQWADAGSLELVGHVVSGLSSGALLVVLTLRDGAASDRDPVWSLLATVARRPGSRRLRVAGLDSDATVELLTQVSQRSVDPDVARVIHQRVEGNPFFAIELQRLLDAEGLDDAPSVAARAVPIGVRDVVRQRLARLPRPTVELLRLAAVAGGDLDVEVLSWASGRSIDTCLDDLEIALAHRVLADVSDTAGLRFSHAIVREVVVDELSSLRRARAQLAIADALIATGREVGETEMVAEHLWAAVPIGAGRRAADALDAAADALDAAADVAIRRFAVGSAIDLLTRSLELRRAAGDEVGDAEAELETLLKLTWAACARSGYQAGLEYYPRGIELARRLGRSEVELEMQWCEWAGYDTSCEFERARPVAERFRARADVSDDPMVRATGYLAAAIQAWHDGDLRESARRFDQVAEARVSLDPESTDMPLVAERLLLSAAFTAYIGEQVGRFADPDAAFDTLLAGVSGNVAVAMVRCFGCTSAASAGDVARVERSARLALEAESGETLGFWGSQARMYLGAVLIATGREAEGRELFAIGQDAYAAAGVRTGAALMFASAASAEVVAGDLGRAAAHLAAAERELERGERWPLPYVLLAEADLAEASGAASATVTGLRARAEAVAIDQGAVTAAGRARAAMAGDPWSIAGRPTTAVGRRDVPSIA